MNELENARKTISRIDREMAALFAERMEAARAIAAYKKERGLPVRDEAREAELIRQNLSYLEDPELEDLYLSFLEHLIGLSRNWQTRLLDE